MKTKCRNFQNAFLHKSSHFCLRLHIRLLHKYTSKDALGKRPEPFNGIQMRLIDCIENKLVVVFPHELLQLSVVVHSEVVEEDYDFAALVIRLDLPHQFL
jgi:hypothetical protein